MRKPVSASSGSEKKRTWTSWKLFENKAKGHKTIELKIPGLNGKSSQVHPVAFMDHFPSQQLDHAEPLQEKVREKSHPKKHAEKKPKMHISGTPSVGPDHQSTAQAAEEDEEDGFEDAAWKERQQMERDSEPSTTTTAANAARATKETACAPQQQQQQRPATSPQLRNPPPMMAALGRDDSFATASHTGSTVRSKDHPQQLVMDDLIRRRASGPMVFRGKTAEIISPVRKSVTAAGAGASATTSPGMHSAMAASVAEEMKLAEQKKSLQMKKLVQEECRKRNSRGVSPYLGKFSVFFLL